jgi:hypothetical protein
MIDGPSLGKTCARLRLIQTGFRDSDLIASIRRPRRNGSVWWCALCLAGSLLFVGGAQAKLPGNASHANSRVGLPISLPLAAGLTGSWVRQAAGERRNGEVRAVARSSRGALAIGDDSGVSWFEQVGVGQIESTPMRAHLAAVRDLAFDGSGRLWIATAEGLYRWDAGARPVRRPLRGGEAEPDMRSIAVAGHAMVVAGAAGAYWSSTGDIFQPLDVGGVATAIDWAAIRSTSPGNPTAGLSGARIVNREGGETAEVWLFGVAGLHRVAGRTTPSGLRVLETERVPSPRPSSDRTGIGVVVGPDAQSLAVVYPDLVALRVLGRGLNSLRDSPAWRLIRPVLAPGAEIRSLAWGRDHVALSTDHGLFVAPDFDSVFARASAPVGTSECAETLPSTGEAPWIAVCRPGVYILHTRPPPNRDSSTLPDSFAKPRRDSLYPPGPALEEIRRRAFERAGLTAQRAAKLWTGLRRRAFWPEVDMRFQADFDRDRHSDFDQAYVSGDTRELSDYGRDQSRGLAGFLSFDWDLGGLVYPLESVDLSRELRQIVSLRDDIADEINQLYFECARIHDRLSAIQAGQIAAEAGEETRLRWRAREILAGLDAWTGGWLSERQRDAASSLTSPLAFPERPGPPVPTDKKDWKE